MVDIQKIIIMIQQRKNLNNLTKQNVFNDIFFKQFAYSVF